MNVKDGVKIGGYGLDFFKTWDKKISQKVMGIYTPCFFSKSEMYTKN